MLPLFVLHPSRLKLCESFAQIGNLADLTLCVLLTSKLPVAQPGHPLAPVTLPGTKTKSRMKAKTKIASNSGSLNTTIPGI
jgi:hypothetical protein